MTLFSYVWYSILTIQTSLSLIYHVTLDELISFDIDVEEIKTTIENISDEVNKKVDWTKLWSEKYPILARYPQEVSLAYYQEFT